MLGVSFVLIISYPVLRTVDTRIIEANCWQRFINPIDMRGCNITSLNPHHFSDYNRISSIDMSENPEFDFPSNGSSFLFHDRLRSYRCENCGITTIHSQTFAGLPELKLVNLRGNYIKSIPADAFIHNRIQFLVVAYNKIEQFNGQHRLEAMDHLLQLDASGNEGFHLNQLSVDTKSFEYIICVQCKISIIQNRWFEQMVNMRKVILENNYIQMIPRNCFSRNKRLSYLNLNNNPLQRLSFASETLEELYCIGCNLTQLDEESFKYLPKLKILMLQKNSIKSVDPRSYISNKWLNTLYLDYNDLTTFPVEILKKSLMLKVLCLDQNLLQAKENTSVFIDLYKALELRNNCAAGPNELYHFEHFLPRTNKLGNYLYDKDLPQCNNLVDVSNRNVVFIHPMAYNNCSSLKTLLMNDNFNFTFHRNYPVLYSESLEVYSCTHCGIGAIYEDTFEHLPQLRKLFLRHNHLKKLPAFDMFAANPQLTTIELDHNHLRQLSVQLFESHKNVSTLNFNHNSKLLFSKEASFLVQQVATVFQASNCAIDHINQLSFSAMPSLLEIDVSHNPITTIHPGAFDRNGQLRILKLSNTHLRVLPVSCVSHLSNLKLLCLDGMQRYATNEPKYSENNERLINLIETKKLHCNDRELVFVSKLVQEKHFANFRTTTRSSGSLSGISTGTISVLCVLTALHLNFW
ncbi:leucine-rich repeats and immunoglobulin-like domains protein sma-10 isoform X2 [Malaya genurostris]|uniref:leucine-rich repeats and immunoglobulin-like domains protein sma-10 isoform X2 n=1 Tax=Malaya genurostris TaxID=325434 RepID=UPI0026F386AA|nr:leucine-rich repeats and immunoglobulin-like domains protein sma-10 isoform X2 [Malaya genurostris]